MNRKFPINTCPICGNDLFQSNYRGIFIAECKQKVMIPLPLANVPHYQVETTSWNKISIQHIVIPPYGIDTYDTDWKSRIFVIDTDDARWKFITETLQIHPDTPDNLIQRIKRLVILS